MPADAAEPGAPDPGAHGLDLPILPHDPFPGHAHMRMFLALRQHDAQWLGSPMTAPDPLHEILRRLILGDGETRIDSFEAADRVLAAGWLPPRPAPSGPCREEIARLFRDFGLDPRDSVHFLLIDVLAGMLGRARTAIAQERT